jgi:precorrin-4 C(11)-methyltransferase
MKIYLSFVGAGSGDVELITVKGLKRLQKADTVIYTGSLINLELLDYCKEDCKKYNSAKMDLQEIIDVIKRDVAEEKYVVRLQTGDFSIYGSIREQIEELNKLNIDYELIPGVSSFLGAASSLKVEYTVPEVSQSLIITRRTGRTPVPEKESLSSFAKHNTSMVIFLSVDKIEDVVRELTVDGGYDYDTPCTVIYKATWADEKIVAGTLADIANKTKEANITKTALILVGGFLGNDYYNSKLYDKKFKHEFRDSDNKSD